MKIDLTDRKQVNSTRKRGLSCKKPTVHSTCLQYVTKRMSLTGSRPCWFLKKSSALDFFTYKSERGVKRGNAF